MTNQEAIQNLIDYEIPPLGKDGFPNDNIRKSFSMAIAALKKIDGAVDFGYLYDWYISSVSSDDEPVWTEAHIEELTNDFVLIPKGENSK